MLRHINIAVAATFLLMAVGCSDLNDIKDRLDSAESRLEALETQVDILKGNLETLTKLKEYHTIKAVQYDESTSTYEITLTNGEQVKLYQGSVGFYSPVMTIDEEGYWKMSLTDAEGTVIEEKHITLNNGEKVSAVGEKGVTPQFRVDGSENWEVSYDEGATWTDVLNEAGQPVKATPDDSADNYFKNVKIENGNLVIEMKDEANTVISLPILGNFYFIIKDENGNDIDELQFFILGETKTYTIDQSDIAEVTVLTCPAGFNVNISGNLLEITAVAETRSLSADSGRDITFLATSASNPGLFVMEKIQVEQTTDPIAVLSKKDANLVSLTFNVKLYNSEGYFFVIKPADQPEATSAEILSGTYSSEAQLTVEGLAPDTEYILYVISTAGEDSYSDIAKLQAKTSAITSYYEAYQSGLDIEIAGTSVNKNTHPDVTLISETGHTIAANGVYFVKPEIEVTVSAKTSVELYYNELIIIGDNPASKNKVIFTANTRWNAGAIVAFKNTEITDEAGSATILQSNGANSTILFDGCNIPTPGAGQFIYLGHAASALKVVDCNILVGADSKVFVNQKYETTDVEFINNIIYSPEGNHLNYRLIAGEIKDAEKLATIKNLTINNNTLANVYAYTEKSNAEYCALTSVTNYTCKNNLLYLKDYEDARYTWLTKVLPTNVTVAGNIVYKNVSTNTRVRYMLETQGGEQAYITTTTKTDTVVSDVDLSKGIIVPASDNGAKR